MKYIFSILFVLLFSSSSFGQKIHFTDGTNRWSYFLYSCGGLPYIVDSTIIRYTRDTIISGQEYKIMINKYGIISLVREDTILNRVYTLSVIHDTEMHEQLLYDFNLAVGDTFNNSIVPYYVADMDSVIINGLKYKTWYMNRASGGWIEYYIVEGIGCVNGPLFPLNTVFLENCQVITCFSNHDSISPLDHKVGYYFDNYSSCGLTFGMGVPNLSGKSPIQKVAPNPINESSKILLPYAIQSGTLQVYNALGQLVVQEKYTHFESIPIGEKVFAPGLYYYLVRDEEGVGEFRGKFVK